MRINGITKSVTRKHVGLSELVIKKGEFKGFKFTIFKEYFKNKPEVKVTFVSDANNKARGYRLVHLNNGRITKKIDRFI